MAPPLSPFGLKVQEIPSEKPSMGVRLVQQRAGGKVPSSVFSQGSCAPCGRSWGHTVPASRCRFAASPAGPAQATPQSWLNDVSPPRCAHSTRARCRRDSGWRGQDVPWRGGAATVSTLRQPGRAGGDSGPKGISLEQLDGALAAVPHAGPSRVATRDTARPSSGPSWAHAPVSSFRRRTCSPRPGSGRCGWSRGSCSVRSRGASPGCIR